MGSRDLHIILAGAGPIVASGIETLLQREGLRFRLSHAVSLAEVSQLLAHSPAGLVMMNPALVQNRTREFLALKKEFGQVGWIALVYALFEPPLLSLFDDSVGIHDTAGQVAATVRKVLQDPSAQPLTQEVLSERETEVLRLLVEGLSNKEIADQLHLSIHTVISHRKNITFKTGIKSVAGLTIYAVVNKLIALDGYPS